MLDSLNYYFDKKRKNIKLSEDVVYTDKIIDLFPVLNIGKKQYKYNIVGIFNEKEETFTWSWHINIHKQQNINTKKLLIWTLNNEVCTLRDAYIKRLLTTGVLTGVNVFTLVTILSLVAYLTKSDRILNSALNFDNTFMHKDSDINTFITCHEITE